MRDSIQPLLLDHAVFNQYLSACRIVRDPLSFPLEKSLTSHSCRKSSVNVHDAPPRDTTTPIMHDPPHNARTGPHRARDHPVGRHTPRRNNLHNAQHRLNQFLAHSPLLSRRSRQRNHSLVPQGRAHPRQARPEHAPRGEPSTARTPSGRSHRPRAPAWPAQGS